MNTYRPENPLIVQGDHTILVEVDSPRYAAARDELLRFAELVKAPEHIHTYRVSPLSVWNARASGVDPSSIVAALREFAKYEVPGNVEVEIRDWSSRYGRLRLTREGDQLVLTADHEALAEQVSRHKSVRPLLGDRIAKEAFRVRPALRGEIKQALVKVGFPAEDLAGYVEGEALAVKLRSELASGDSFALRPYQQEAVDAFHACGSERGGSGVITLPCGAGKTIVAMACMARLQTSTLVLTTSVTASRQWMRELLEKTTLTEDEIGEYSGWTKQIRPVTFATYQIMTWRKKKDAPFEHMELFDQRNWGLIVYDEVHLLPAPIFRATAGLQARRRLGLTATLVREDRREDDVFALIGPKKADVPWKVLEGQGWIATAHCVEVRLPLDSERRMRYAVAERRDQFRIAAENESKIEIVRALLERHSDDLVLIIGMYLDQLKKLAEPPRHSRVDRRHEAKRARRGLRKVSAGEASGAGGFENRQLRRRPPRRLGGDPNLGHFRFATGRGTATRPHLEAEGGRQSGALSIRWSRATPWNRNSRSSDNCFCASRATVIRSSTPRNSPTGNSLHEGARDQLAGLSARCRDVDGSSRAGAGSTVPAEGSRPDFPCGMNLPSTMTFWSRMSFLAASSMAASLSRKSASLCCGSSGR